MAFSSGFLSPPSSQALSWTSHTVSILILPDLYWVHPGSSASCSGPKQNKIWISAWYILKNDPVLHGESRLGCDLAAANFLFLSFFPNCRHTDRDLKSPKFTHKSTHRRMHTCMRAHTHARTLANKPTGFIFCTLSTRGFAKLKNVTSASTWWRFRRKQKSEYYKKEHVI